MSKEGIYVKVADALNYREKAVGIIIGSEDGGTIGRIVGRKICLIIPAGLERFIYEKHMLEI